MKDSTSIEKQISQRFEHFEGDVDPALWKTIQQNIQVSPATSASAAKGYAKIAGTVAKITVITAAVATTAWFFSQKDQQQSISVPETTTVERAEEIDAPLVGEGSHASAEEHVSNHIARNCDVQEDDQKRSSTYHSPSSPQTGGEEKAADHPVLHPIQTFEGATVDTVLKGKDNQVKEQINYPPVESHSKTKVEQLTAHLQFSMEGKKVHFESNAEHHKSVNWNFGDGTFARGDRVKHVYQRPGNYRIEMTVFGEENQRKFTRQLTIKSTSSIEKIANVFTPNNDGINDFFFIDSKEIQTFYISIRDIRGREVFTSDDSHFEWDGRQIDGSIERGMYRYSIIAEGSDGQQFKIQNQLYIQ